MAQRLTPEEAQGLARSRAAAPEAAPAVAEAAPPTRTTWSAAPTTGAVAALDRPPLPSPEIVGLPARTEASLPVLDRRPRRRPFERLLAIVRGRRRAEAPGRHRPDTIPSSGWSMFAPHRRSRRRFGARR